MSLEDLPVVEFGFPGPLRDQLVAAVLDGTKTTTTGLVADYEHEGDPLPEPGLRQAVVDSQGNRVAAIQATAVRVLRVADVDLAHALGEGEGYTSVAEWRAVHEQFWHSPEVREALGDPEFTVNDDTPVVAWTFRLADGLASVPSRVILDLLPQLDNRPCRIVPARYARVRIDKASRLQDGTRIENRIAAGLTVITEDCAELGEPRIVLLAAGGNNDRRSLPAHSVLCRCNHYVTELGPGSKVDAAAQDAVPKISKMGSFSIGQQYAVLSLSRMADD